MNLFTPSQLSFSPSARHTVSFLMSYMQRMTETNPRASHFAGPMPSLPRIYHQTIARLNSTEDLLNPTEDFLNTTEVLLDATEKFLNSTKVLLCSPEDFLNSPKLFLNSPELPLCSPELPGAMKIAFRNLSFKVYNMLENSLLAFDSSPPSSGAAAPSPGLCPWLRLLPTIETNFLKT